VLLFQAVSFHPDGLGSGWRMVILALRLGAADGSPAVMAQAQEALQLVVGQLYLGPVQGSAGGHTFLRETVQVGRGAEGAAAACLCCCRRSCKAGRPAVAWCRGVWDEAATQCWCEECDMSCGLMVCVM
jgi:hypothetical protein